MKKDLQQAARVAVISALVTIAVTVPGTWIVTRQLETWKDRGARALAFGAYAFSMQADHKYVPILGISYDDRPINIYVVAAVNAGTVEQRNVSVSLALLGSVIAAFPDGRFPVSASGGPVQNDFSSFVGKDYASFVIPSLPAGAYYGCAFVCNVEPGSPMPMVHVQSDTTAAMVVPSFESVNSSVKEVLGKLPWQAAFHPDTLQSIDWDTRASPEKLYWRPAAR